MMHPQFVQIGDRIIAVHEIKWAGMKKREDSEERDLYVEFISGGWCLLAGRTVEELQNLLSKL